MPRSGRPTLREVNLNVKKVKLRALKETLLHECLLYFSRFLKLYRCYQIAQSVSY